jgi:hypothetical protein
MKVGDGTLGKGLPEAFIAVFVHKINVFEVA